MYDKGDWLERESIYVEEEWRIEVDTRGGAKVTIDTLLENVSKEKELNLTVPYKFTFREEEKPNHFQCDAFKTDNYTIFLNLNLRPGETKTITTNLSYATLASRGVTWWDISLTPQYGSLSPQKLTIKCFLPMEAYGIRFRTTEPEDSVIDDNNNTAVNTFHGPPYYFKLAYKLGTPETGLEERALSEQDLQTVKDAMPLLQTFANNSSRDHRGNLFGDMTFLIALHFLKDLIVFLESCEKLGLKPGNGYLFWKDYLYPYKDEIITYLQDKGYNVYPLSDLESVLESQKESMNGVLVLEDGGYIVTSLHNKFRDILDKTVGAVEQTTKGIRRDKEVADLAIPILNVAEAEIKKRVEPPFVADVAVRNIEDLLSSPSTPLRQMKTALMGLGAIGSEILERLRDKVQWITVYDPDPIRRIEARIRGSTEAEREAYNAVRGKNLVIGCSGEKSIKEHEILALQNGTYLVSVSSDQVEIDIDFLNDSSSDKRPCLTGASKEIGTSYDITGRDVTIHLLADGYPVNFWKKESMPNQVSDLILSVIFLSAIELAKNNSEDLNGFQNVDEIVKKYQVAEKYENRYFP